MKLQKNTSYLLNFGHREGKTTALVKAVLKNAKTSPDKTSLIIVPTYATMQLIKKQLMDTSIQKGIKLTRQLTLSNGHKIKVVVGDKNTNLDVIRGIFVDYLYVDEIQDLHFLFREQLFKPYTGQQVSTVICTTTMNVGSLSIKEYLDSMASILKPQTIHYIIKPCTTKHNAVQYDSNNAQFCLGFQDVRK